VTKTNKYPGITVEMIETKLREVAKKNARKVYNPLTNNRDNCEYYPTRNPVSHRMDRCIFGQTFHELGVTDADLKAGDRNLMGILNDLFGIDLSEEGDDITQWTRLRNVQAAQDDGKSWGEAIKFLDRDKVYY